MWIWLVEVVVVSFYGVSLKGFLWFVSSGANIGEKTALNVVIMLLSLIN